MTQTKRLLVVDDDVDFADSLADLLAVGDVEVEVAYNGHDGLARVREQCFDLMLVDMQMPGLDGVHSLRAMRVLRPSARVVMMTGFSAPERQDQAILSGAADVLHKPLDLDRVRDLVDGASPKPLVLLADDDRDFVESLRAVLERQGFVVMAACSGRELVERAIERRPDVLLLDLRMPGMSGIDAWRALDAQGVRLPTIVVSAYVDAERASLAALDVIPAEQIMNKPVETQRLLRLVERVTGLS